MHSIAPDPRECQVINENDGVLKYGPGWVLTSGDPNGESLTSHSTTVNGSTVDMDFSGTSIVVFGTVQQSNNSSPPPNASYSIDGRPAFDFTLPASAMCIPNQQFFHSPPLHPGQHNLTITISTTGTPYVLDYLWVCSPSPSTSAPQHNSSHIDAVIVGSVLGGVIFLFGLAAAVWFCIRRRRRARKNLRMLQISASPVSSWLHRQNSSPGATEVVFTSTESVMRDNAAYSPTTDSKERMARELAISMPIATARMVPGSPELTMPPGLRMSTRPMPDAPVDYTPHSSPSDGHTGLAPPPWAARMRR
ncbi:hypothetical protein C2E23DRAFT_730912 [Lenzites betulinus]|nr:hypothetical protein C2E23DRAFT_730912 [Lenzites betulinus]